MAKARTKKKVDPVPAHDAEVREAAITDILRVIASSPGHLQPVFDTILDHTIRLTAGHVAALWQYDGQRLRYAASLNSPAEVVSYMREHPLELGDWNPTPQAALERRVMNVLDVFANPKFRPLIPPGTSGKRPNAGTVLAVPLVRGDELFGVITVWRYVQRLFTEREVDLVKTFTAQAVIAVQNVRLFNETKEALEQQTATADILRVISSSPASVQPVFEAILDKATDLCEAQLGILFLREGDVWRMVSHRGASAEAQEAHREIRPGPNTGLGRMRRDRRPVHIEDLLVDADTPQRDPVRVSTVQKLGARTFLAVPLLKDGDVIGAVVIYRKEVRPFGEAQIRLVGTFADQAVIAIENVRLLNETKEALEQQTATADVLKVISASPTDVAPVFDAILKSAVALCDAELAAMFSYDGKVVDMVATHNWPREALEYFAKVYPSPPSATLLSGRTILGKSLVQIADAAADEHYDPNSVETGHWRRMLGVPLMRGGEPLGAMVVAWREPGQTPRRQVELLQTFADQAAIAIENVRLFNETKESLEQQTAISEVLRVISGSPADVQPGLDAVAERAARICAAQYTDIVLVDRGGIRVAAGVGDLRRTGRDEIVPLDRGTVMGRSILDRTPIHIADVLEGGDEFPRGRAMALQFGHRALLAVPLIRENRALGTILVRRTEAKPFEDKLIALLKTFADQAAIAIENVRLFNETAEALERQTATSDILKVISRTIFDLQPVLEIVLSNARKLCEADRGFIFRPDENGDYRPVAYA
ncbi:MAG TPA: GAF domain-containing protein, partial [Burkholderiales bacterium]